jgi:hypothetical protein
MTTKKKTLEIKFDPTNARHHSDENKALINKSISKLGAGRSVVADSEGFIIGGNQTLEEAREIGLKERIVETEGDELIIVVRKDLKYNDKKRKELAIVDNSATDSSSFIEEVFDEEYFEEVDVSEWRVTPEQADYAGRNKEVDVDDLEGNVKLTLEYTLEEYHEVKSALARIAHTPEEAIWQLLKLEH